MSESWEVTAADEIERLREDLRQAEAERDRLRFDLQECLFACYDMADECEEAAKTTKPEDTAGRVADCIDKAESRVRELERDREWLHELIERTAQAWIRGCGSVPWEGAIDAAMVAAVGEIERLRGVLQLLRREAGNTDTEIKYRHYAKVILNEALTGEKRGG